jgi:hypothetical protein
MPDIVQILCNATGVDTIALSPAGTTTIVAYANGQQFTFEVPANTTGPVTAAYESLAALPVYHPDGATQLGSIAPEAVGDLGFFPIGVLFGGSIAAVQYGSWLNAGAGGFQLISMILCAPQMSVGGYEASSYGPSQLPGNFNLASNGQVESRPINVDIRLNATSSGPVPTDASQSAVDAGFLISASNAQNWTNGQIGCINAVPMVDVGAVGAIGGNSYGFRSQATFNSTGVSFGEFTHFLKGTNGGPGAANIGQEFAFRAMPMSGETVWAFFADQNPSFFGGSVRIGSQVTLGDNERTTLAFNGNSEWGNVSRDNTATANAAHIVFQSGATQAGLITTNGATTTYGTTSDRRLKKDIKPLGDAGKIIDRLKPSKWRWKQDGKEGVGFVAQELVRVVPHAVVRGTKRRPWARDDSALVAYLVAEIQSLRKRLAKVEKRR